MTACVKFPRMHHHNPWSLGPHSIRVLIVVGVGRPRGFDAFADVDLWHGEEEARGHGM